MRKCGGNRGKSHVIRTINQIVWQNSILHEPSRGVWQDQIVWQPATIIADYRNRIRWSGYSDNSDKLGYLRYAYRAEAQNNHRAVVVFAKSRFQMEQPDLLGQMMSKIYACAQRIELTGSGSYWSEFFFSLKEFSGALIEVSDTRFKDAFSFQTFRPGQTNRESDKKSCIIIDWQCS